MVKNKTDIEKTKETQFETHKSSWSQKDLPELNLEIIGNAQIFYG